MSSVPPGGHIPALFLDYFNILQHLAALPSPVIIQLRRTFAYARPTEPERKTYLVLFPFPILNSSCANVQICRRTLMVYTINIPAVATRVVLSQ